ncbi:restriction endonuclease [Clostridium botulinum]|uniref:restriction endonuclease n=1 Tax=Clostridium botulinum TaxID=1491 RepID=UPI001969B625|nr:restriction endonuclease [Clostridium botulinum]
MNIEFQNIENADLIIDAVYEGGSSGNLSDDVLSKLMLCENSGGFRKRGKTDPFNIYYVVLYSSGNDIDWMDTIELETGRFIYYGDNKSPGRELHDTPKKGNKILKKCFELLNKNQRENIPPFFIFTKEKKRDIKFRGLAVPGDDRIRPQEQLMALWSAKNGDRFQNYRAVFTILNINKIPREWIKDLSEGNGYRSKFAPIVWKKWVKDGKYNQLLSKKVIEFRTKEEQIPNNKNDVEIIKTIYDFFEDGYSFEPCAVKIAQLMDKNIVSYELTQPFKDGGRDCIGQYRIGLPDSSILINFALEAKRYDLKNGVGVKETSRLISRLKYREFGILVTTSFIGLQAYKEIKEDGHPVIIISAIDIVNILNMAGYKYKEDVQTWLEMNFK